MENYQFLFIYQLSTSSKNESLEKGSMYGLFDF